jgi:hypothetical protein
VTEPHPYTERQGLDWCRICGKARAHHPEEIEMDEQYPILAYFAYQHLSDKLQAVARPFAELAEIMAVTLPRNAETSAGLRKLLEAKDCFVRAAL